MNENPTDGTINNTPPAEPAPTTPDPIPPAEPAPIAPEPTPQVEPAPVPDQPAAPPEPSQKSVVNKPLVIVLVIILVALLGALAYFLFFQNNSGQVPENTDTGQVEEEEEEEVPETTIDVSSDTISPLFKLLLILHQPSLLTDGPRTIGYSLNQYFTFYSSYNVSEHLYPDASELTFNDKLSIVTRYASSYAKPVTEFNVPSDFYASKYPEYCADTATDPLCSNNEGNAISEEDVAAVYYEIFGEKPDHFESPTSFCGSRAYDSTYHFFYSTIAGCGGVDPLYHQVYIEKYTATDKKAYVYIRTASIYNTYSGVASDNSSAVYKTFLKHADFYDQATQTDLTPDESLVYSRSLELLNTQAITADNYTEFEAYRFVFEKDGDGNYFFKTVEKL